MEKIKSFIKENTLISILLLLFFVTLIIIGVVSISNKNTTGTGSSNTSEADGNNKHLSELDEVGKSAKYTKVKDTNCPQLSGVIYATGDQFITELDGKYYLYDYVIEKKYSDETNCRLVEELEKKPIMFTYDSLFWGDDHTTLQKTTYIVYEDLTYAKMSNPNDYNMKKVYSSYDYTGTALEDGNYIIETPSYDYEVVKWKNGTDSFKIKNEFLDTTKYGKEWKVGKCAISYMTSISNNIFLELTIDEPISKYLDGAVVTDRAIYTWGLFDDSCLTYADVECEFGFVKNLDLEDKYDDIIFVNKQYIVFKDGTTYAYQDL